MLKNYFKTAFRNLIRNKNFTIINISGLAIGIAVCMMIFIIIEFHSDFDNFHLKKDQIYRVLTEYHHADSKDVFNGRGVPYGLPQALKTSFSQIEQVAPVIAGENDLVIVLNNANETVKKFKEEKGLFYTTPSFFQYVQLSVAGWLLSNFKRSKHCFIVKRNCTKILW